jgi:pimeloyl-ACP methyl ester carboxylesterase
VEAITVLGLEIAYERRGRGTPVVLLHSGASDHREWRRQLDALADEFDLVAWDAPGNGASDDPPPDWRMPEYADCLAAFAAALGLDRPHVVGLSFGGTLALEVYCRHPELPRSLVLASAYAGWAGSLPPEVVAARLEAVERDLELPPEQLTARWLPDLLTEQAPQQLREELTEIMVAFHPGGARPMVHAMAEADLRDVLPTIGVPTLLLYGDADVRSPRELAETLHAAIPGSALTFVPNAPHMLNMEAAEAVNEALLASSERRCGCSSSTTTSSSCRRRGRARTRRWRSSSGRPTGSGWPQGSSATTASTCSRSRGTTTSTGSSAGATEAGSPSTSRTTAGTSSSRAGGDA